MCSEHSSLQCICIVKVSVNNNELEFVGFINAFSSVERRDSLFRNYPLPCSDCPSELKNEHVDNIFEKLMYNFPFKNSCIL